MSKVQVEIIGISASASAGGGYALLLKEVFGPRRIPIVIGSFEAQSIAAILENIKPPRPLTHDLLRSVINELGAIVVEVFIDEIIEGTFYSKLILELSGLTIDIDSRPSDAIAVAVRTKSPIYMNSTVIDRTGFVPSSDTIISKSAEKLEKDSVNDEFISHIASSQANISYLEKQLKDAIEKEDYERAASLRDEISKLTKNS